MEVDMGMTVNDDAALEELLKGVGDFVLDRFPAAVAVAFMVE